jgi:hypothetical protein
LLGAVVPFDKIYNGGSSNTKKVLDANWILMTLMVGFVSVLVLWSSTLDMNSKMAYIKKD